MGIWEVRNLTVKSGKFSSSVMGYMRKLEFTAGFFASILLLSPTTGFCEAEYYTWVDENGVTNYAERNPQGYEARYISRESKFGPQFGRRAAVPEQPETNAETNAESEVDSEAPQSDEDVGKHIVDERARIDAEIALAKKNNCGIGKRNLAQLEAYARIRIKDDDGREHVLSDQEKKQRISKAKKTIRENCTG